MDHSLYAIGNALVDMEFHIKDERLEELGLKKGTMRLVDKDAQEALRDHLKDSMTGRVGGGSAANTSYAYSALGKAAFYCCRVGDDEDGHYFLKDMHDAGVMTDELAYKENTCSTGNCLVMISPDGERTMQTYLGASYALGPAQVALSHVPPARLFYIEGYLSSSDSAKAAVALARAQARLQGAKICITFSDPSNVQHYRQGLLELMYGGVDYLFCNQEEARLFAGVESIDLAANCLNNYSKVVIITRGAEGAYVSDAQTNNTYRISAAPVKQVVDTNGAGDAFAAGFLYGLEAGLTIEEGGKIGSALSAAVVQQYGARLPFEEYKEILAALGY